MKKTLGLFAMLLLILSILNAVSQAAGTCQTIAGFINHIESKYMKLVVSNDIDSSDENYDGFNLDVSDSNNLNRFLITPSATHELGLRIGTLNLETTNQGYTMRIYHTPLTLVSDSSSASIDYELSIQYSISGEESLSSYCVSTSDISNPDNLIDVTLNSSGGVIIIQNAGLYFRLTNVSQVRTVGQYQSDIYIRVGSEE